MSENIQSISQGTFTIGSTSATNFVAGPGITITEPSAGTVRIANDETVLYSGATTNAATLSDDLRNYTTFKAFVQIGQSNHSHMVHELDASSDSWGLVQGWGESTSSNCSVVCIRIEYDSTNNKLNCTNRKIINFGTWNNNTATPTASYFNNPSLIYKVVGINRKEV